MDYGRVAPHRRRRSCPVVSGSCCTVGASLMEMTRVRVKRRSYRYDCTDPPSQEDCPVRAVRSSRSFLLDRLPLPFISHPPRRSYSSLASKCYSSR